VLNQHLAVTKIPMGTIVAGLAHSNSCETTGSARDGGEFQVVVVVMEVFYTGIWWD
jgi:hypothetical protein